MKTSKVSELMWFFNVGLSGMNGLLKGKWKVKTLETLLRENNHLDVMLPIIACHSDIKYVHTSGKRRAIGRMIISTLIN